VTAKHGSAAHSTTTNQSGPTWSTVPGVNTLPVGSANASVRPAVVVTRRRPQRRSSAVSTSVSRVRPASGASPTSEGRLVITGTSPASARGVSTDAPLRLSGSVRSTAAILADPPSRVEAQRWPDNAGQNRK
jgi:hypothetical protein